MPNAKKSITPVAKSAAKKPVTTPPVPKTRTTTSAPRRTIPVPADPGPVWEGPDGSGPNGGVTYSLLCRFLTCPERFRLFAVEGLKPPERFVAPIEFGNLWHAAEEAHAKGDDWVDAVNGYAQFLFRKFPHDRDEVAQWYDKCRTLFPLYVEYWAAHDDVKGRTPLLSEQTFDVPYRLLSGRTVRLRGKWDSVDLVNDAVWLQENKTKSGIDRQAITRQLTFDLQTMFYVVALDQAQEMNEYPLPLADVKGVRYNVVRRSAHKGSAGKVSAAESMLKKFREDEAAGRVDEWFARWNVEVSPEDVVRFRARCLDPLLERLCRWWYWIGECRKYGGGPFGPDHYQHPFGVRNILDEGGATDLDECILTGSTVGLTRTMNLFPELQEG